MNKKPRIVKYKVTSEVYKNIVNLVPNLVQLQRTNSKGVPLCREISKVVKGFDLPAGTKIKGKDPDPKKNYVQRGSEPLLVNHQVNLISEYELHGQKGIDDYVAYVNELHALSEEQQKNIKVPLENEAK